MKNMAIIAATPGYFIVEPVTEDRKKIVEAVLVPIIGWMIQDGFSNPITLFQTLYDNDFPILTPSGIVFDAFQTPYDSVQDWINLHNEESNAIQAQVKACNEAHLLCR